MPSPGLVSRRGGNPHLPPSPLPPPFAHPGHCTINTGGTRRRSCPMEGFTSRKQKDLPPSRTDSRGWGAEGTAPLLQGCVPPCVPICSGSQLCRAPAVLVTHLFVNASFGEAASPLTALKERRGCQWEVFKDFLDVFRFLPVKTQPQTNTTKQTAPPN